MIEAAGGLVWRVSAKGTLKVLLVHRPRYDDWSFPKGKLELHETHLQAALREVIEESGLRCTPTAKLPQTRYHDRKGRPKRVRYWAMKPLDGSFALNDEVDKVRWLTVDVARAQLTRPHDVPVLVRLDELFASEHGTDPPLDLSARSAPERARG